MPTQKEIDPALKAVAELRELNSNMGRRYPRPDEEMVAALAAAEKARTAA
jgi:hypothetical protein